MWVRGNLFEKFEVLADNATVYVNYKNVATPGPRCWVFRAVTIPTWPTSVYFSMMF